MASILSKKIILPALSVIGYGFYRYKQAEHKHVTIDIRRDKDNKIQYATKLLNISYLVGEPYDYTYIKWIPRENMSGEKFKEIVEYEAKHPIVKHIYRLLYQAKNMPEYEIITKMVKIDGVVYDIKDQC